MTTALISIRIMLHHPVVRDFQRQSELLLPFTKQKLTMPHQRMNLRRQMTTSIDNVLSIKSHIPSESVEVSGKKPCRKGKITSERTPYASDAAPKLHTRQRIVRP